MQTTGKKPAIPRKNKISWRWIYFAIATALVLFYVLNPSASPKEVNWQEFERNMLVTGAVEKIEVINKERAEIYIKPAFGNQAYFREVVNPAGNRKIRAGPHFFLIIGSVESFEKKLEAAQAAVPAGERALLHYSNRSFWFWDLFLWIIPAIVLFVFWRYLLRRAGGSGEENIFNFGKSKVTMLEQDTRSAISFDDVAGLDEAELEVTEIVSFLKNPGDYTRLGAKIPKGVILVGPPGTGKTLLAKAVAGEAGVPFFPMSGSEFVEMFVGVGASRVRDLFRKAKEKSPCIIFIDEIDAIGRSRGKNAFYTGSNDERESTLNQLLKEMDGFGSNSGVIVLAATNRGDMLDPALLRPGRFDRHIYLELPNMKEREAIFKVHLRPLKLQDPPDLHMLASQTPGFSGADIANVCNEAALIAARKQKNTVEKSDFIDAIDRIVAGLERKTKIIAPEEKKLVAFHEAGHAVVSWLLEKVDPLLKVSIIPRGKSLGAAWYLPEERQMRSVTAFTEMLCAGMGGRAAEEIIFGEVSTGGLDDLEKATRQAYMMVAWYGFNRKVGNISFYDSTGQLNNTFQKPYGEETARLIDDEVRKLLNDVYDHARDLLTLHKDELTQLAMLLLKKEVIFKEDIEAVLGSRGKNVKAGKTTALQPQ